VGLAEEGVFRGYIQRRMTDLWKFLPALLFTSILFRVYHKNFFTASVSDVILTILAITPSFGIFAGYFYHKSRGNLLGPIALHMFYDLFGTIVPLGIDTTEVHPAVVIVSNDLAWSALIIALKLLTDRTRVLQAQ